MTSINLPEGFAVLADGGCRNNQGPVSDREMYGSIKVYHNGKPIRSEWAQHVDTQHTMQFDHKDGHASNQVAELIAMECALTYAYRLRDRRACQGKDLTAITILDDSEYALGWGSGAYKGNKDTKALVLKYKEIFSGLRTQLKDNQVDVRFQHVPESWVKTQLGH